MAETVFACKQVEELALQQMGSLLAASHTEFARLAENLFVRDRPADAGDGNGDQQHLNDFYA